MKTFLKIIGCLAIVCTFAGCFICRSSGFIWSMAVRSDDSIQITIPSFYSTTKQSVYMRSAYSTISSITDQTSTGVKGDVYIEADYNYSKGCSESDGAEEYVDIEHIVHIKRLTHNAPIKIVTTNQPIGFLLQENWFGDNAINRDSVFDNIVQYCGEESMIEMPVDMDELRVVVYTPRK